LKADNHIVFSALLKIVVSYYLILKKIKCGFKGAQSHLLIWLPEFNLLRFGTDGLASMITSSFSKKTPHLLVHPDRQDSNRRFSVAAACSSAEKFAILTQLSSWFRYFDNPNVGFAIIEHKTWVYCYFDKIRAFNTSTHVFAPYRTILPFCSFHVPGSLARWLAGCCPLLSRFFHVQVLRHS
jgi:hypothetical protein